MPGMVTVGCKLPHGLLIQLQKPETISRPVMGGGMKDVVEYQRTGELVKIHGYAHRRDKAPAAVLASPNCALTQVDADFFNEWLSQNRDMPAVKNGFIFARGKQDDARSEARSLDKHMNGLEPFDPENPVPEFRRKIETKKD